MLAPELVVEVLSESNTRAEMDRKRGEYFAAGVLQVWEFNPDSRNVTVYDADGKVTLLEQGSVLECQSILPGFTLPLQPLFARLDGVGN